MKLLWAMALIGTPSAWALPFPVAQLFEGRLIGGSPGPAMGGAGFPDGPTLELEAGGVIPIPAQSEPHEPGFAAGGAIGYQFATGFEPLLRYEVLGTAGQLIDYRDLRALAFGARYTLPFLFVSPFAEVTVGPAFVEATTLLGPAQSVGFGAGIGLGLCVPLGRHFALGFAARDWLVDAPSGFLQAIELQGFLKANFGLLFRR